VGEDGEFVGSVAPGLVGVEGSGLGNAGGMGWWGRWAIGSGGSIIYMGTCGSTMVVYT